jgi:hypothetical protein
MDNLGLSGIILENHKLWYVVRLDNIYVIVVLCKSINGKGDTNDTAPRGPLMGREILMSQHHVVH